MYEVFRGLVSPRLGLMFRKDKDMKVTNFYLSLVFYIIYFVFGIHLVHIDNMGFNLESHAIFIIQSVGAFFTLVGLFGIGDECGVWKYIGEVLINSNNK